MGEGCRVRVKVSAKRRCFLKTWRRKPSIADAEEG